MMDAIDSRSACCSQCRALSKHRMAEVKSHGTSSKAVSRSVSRRSSEACCMKRSFSIRSELCVSPSKGSCSDVSSDSVVMSADLSILPAVLSQYGVTE
jgi:hypothetical protein